MKRRRVMKLKSAYSQCDKLTEDHNVQKIALLAEIKNLTIQVLDLQVQLANATPTSSQWCSDDDVQKFNGAAVCSEEFCAADLSMENFEGYYSQLLKKYPILGFIVRLLLSVTHWHKASAKSTSLQWKTWSFLYKTFILEVVLRLKNAKATFQTPILLALVCTYGNVPDTVWELLRRLRLVCLHKKIEDWIRSQKGNEVPADNVVLFSFDNCDFYQHITNV